jgi:hypothetical protein
MAHKTLVADSVILSIVILMLVVMLWLTYKVYKLTYFTDKVLILMLIFLDITLACKFE